MIIGSKRDKSNGYKRAQEISVLFSKTTILHQDLTINQKIKKPDELKKSREKISDQTPVAYSCSAF
jgi:hypothetical protein